MLIKTIALSIATVLGSYLDDLVIVGGLVPTLLIPHAELAENTEPHAGTMDLDLGLEITIFDKKRYTEISDCLRTNGFEQDEDRSGKPVPQRWRHKKMRQVTIDFLIQQTDKAEKGGDIKHFEEDFSAYVIPGIEFAFDDPIKLELSGRNLWDEEVTRTIQICNPGVFVMLKALAIPERRKPKDAYDLYYVIRNYGDGVEEVARYLQPLIKHDICAKAVKLLKDEFANDFCSGPMRVAEFCSGDYNAEIRADVVGYVAALLKAVKQ